jgi:hypothetical protein
VDTIGLFHTYRPSLRADTTLETGKALFTAPDAAVEASKPTVTRCRSLLQARKRQRSAVTSVPRNQSNFLAPMSLEDQNFEKQFNVQVKRTFSPQMQRLPASSGGASKIN